MDLFSFLLLIAGLFFGQTAASPPIVDCGTPSGPAGEIVRGPGYTGVIMPEAAAEAMVSSFFAIQTESWTPAEADISHLEADWSIYLQKGQSSDSQLGIKAGGYHQYAGFIREGQHFVLVNSFRTTSVIEDMDWTRDPVFVMDGGSCFYHVTYNVDTGAFSHLLVNGVG